MPNEKKATGEGDGLFKLPVKGGSSQPVTGLGQNQMVRKNSTCEK